MTKNTLVLRDHVTVVPSVRINTDTAISPLRDPARSPAALGSTEPLAATDPAIIAPTTITPPPTVASEFGSQFITAVAVVQLSFRESQRARPEEFGGPGQLRAYAELNICTYNQLPEFLTLNDTGVILFTEQA
jgi:hypothetical protein